MFIVYWVSHVDCYKRAESSGGIDKVFESKEKAYEYAVKKNCKEINDMFGMSKENWLCMKNPNITYQKKYDYLLEKFEEIYGEPEFTMAPSHTFYHVQKHNKFDDDSFEKTLEKINILDKNIKELTMKDEDEYSDDEEEMEVE